MILQIRNCSCLFKNFAAPSSHVMIALPQSVFCKWVSFPLRRIIILSHPCWICADMNIIETKHNYSPQDMWGSWPFLCLLYHVIYCIFLICKNMKIVALTFKYKQKHCKSWVCTLILILRPEVKWSLKKTKNPGAN